TWICFNHLRIRIKKSVFISVIRGQKHPCSSVQSVSIRILTYSPWLQDHCSNVNLSPSSNDTGSNPHSLLTLPKSNPVFAGRVAGWEKLDESTRFSSDASNPSTSAVRTAIWYGVSTSFPEI